MTAGRRLWAEILALDGQHGDRTMEAIKERIRTLALAGDAAGIVHWRALAALEEQLRGGNGTMRALNRYQIEFVLIATTMLVSVATAIFGWMVG